MQPYLLSLGMSKAMTAIVWVAGPLSGIIVQPYVGAMSDNCRIKWGRRKPYMIGGALLSIIFVMLFVWAEKIVTCFLTAANVDEGHKSIKIVTIVFAIVCFYFLDFSINICK
jgi:solute carrier family 45, member 1/2/4